MICEKVSDLSRASGFAKQIVKMVRDLLIVAIPSIFMGNVSSFVVYNMIGSFGIIFAPSPLRWNAPFIFLVRV